MTRREGVAWRKIHVVTKNQIQDKVARRTPKGLTVREEMSAESGMHQGNKDPSLKEANVSEER
jgi:hypothetical protein